MKFADDHLNLVVFAQMDLNRPETINFADDAYVRSTNSSRYFGSLLQVRLTALAEHQALSG